MPFGVLLGIGFFALEMIGLAWLVYWLLTHTDHFLIICLGLFIALMLTALAIAAVVVAGRADDAMDDDFTDTAQCKDLSNSRGRAGKPASVPDVTAKSEKAALYLETAVQALPR